MATDATGTPTTNFSIPKFDTTNDSPSGLGFNAAMDAIDTTLLGFPQAPAGIVSGEAMVYNGTTWVRSSVTKLGLGSIAQGGATSGQALTWNGSAWAPSTISSGATVATSTAGLPGSPANGELAMIRAGSSSYDFLPLIYDSTYTKWVSPVYARIELGSRATGHGALTNSYAYISQIGLDLIPYGTLKTAGLTLQCRLWIRDFYGGSAGTTYAQVHTLGQNDNGTDTGNGFSAVTGQELTTTLTSTTNAMELSKLATPSWSDISTASADSLAVTVYAKHSASASANIAGSRIEFRWVA